MNTKLLWAAIGLATLSVFSVDFIALWRSQKATAVESEGHSRVGHSRVEVIPITTGATGPESLAFDQDGEGPYTGVSDGRILKWEGERSRWLEYAVVSPPHLLHKCKGSRDPKREHLCGRPLGLQFNKKTQDLYIADAYLGLLKVRLDNKFAKPVVTHAQGLPFHFTNSLDIDQDSGIIYFTDSSMRFRRREFMSTIIAGDKSGRVVRYVPRNNDVQVLLNGLSFPNGVALSQDGSFLLIAETTTCRILRYWLRPPKIAKVEVLIQLPGFPDNIRRSPRGGFWVAIHSRRGKLLEWLLSLPRWLREVFLWFPIDLYRIFSLLSRWTGKSLALRISEEGKVLEVLEYFGGKMVRFISEVEEQNGTLWIGSVLMPSIGVYKL